MQATRLQSSDQTAVLVYADVGFTLSRSPKDNTNISLQLGDDCIQYADIKHHQTSELRSRECNSHTGMLPQLPITLHVILYTVSNPTHCIHTLIFNNRHSS